MSNKFNMLTLDSFLKYLKNSDDDQKEEFLKVITDINRFEELLIELERRSFIAFLNKGRM